jgi:hypothetical protein
MEQDLVPVLENELNRLESGKRANKRVAEAMVTW